MADKFRKIAPLDITFVDGEQPSAKKLTALSDQSRNGLSLVEYALGDKEFLRPSNLTVMDLLLVDGLADF